MKRLSSTLLAAVVALVMSTSFAHAADRYFDVNDTGDGSGVADDAIYNWDLASLNWNPNSAGTDSAVAWANGDTAHFSAGTDAAGKFFGLGIAAGVTASNAIIEEGRVVVTSGVFDTGTGSITVKAGATIDQLAAAGAKFNNAGKIVLEGGALFSHITASAGSIIGSLKDIEIVGSGIIGYDDTDGIPDNKVSIYQGIIRGGDPLTGGAGTLIKRGPDQIGIGGRDIGGGVQNWTQFGFAKLRVEEGAYRLRNNAGVIDERAFGAVPVSTLADAITLDGGGIGSNQTVTLDAKRGITVTANGGYLDHGAGASMVIPGPLTGAGTLSIGSPTSTAVGAPGFTLSNTGNVNTFTGGLVGVRGLLTLGASLKVAGLADSVGATSGPNAATISIASGQVLSVGTGNGNDVWSTAIGGAGGFTKLGTGSQTLGAVNTYSGDTHIDAGTLSIANAYLNNGADVYLKTGGIFNLTFSGTDTIDSLFIDGVSQAVGEWGGVGSGAAHESALITGGGRLLVQTLVAAGLLGDFNSNNVVDAADFITWRENDLANAALPNDNGLTTQAARFDLWKANFGKTNPGSGAALGTVAAVPEPATLVMVLAAIGLCFTARRSR